MVEKKKGTKKKTTVKKKTVPKKKVTHEHHVHHEKAVEKQPIIVQAPEVKTDPLLIENFVSLQRVLTHLSVKLDGLTGQISKMLELFDISAKALAERNFEIEKENKDMLDKLDTLVDQNKVLARGLTLMHERAPPVPPAMPPMQPPLQMAPPISSPPQMNSPSATAPVGMQPSLSTSPIEEKKGPMTQEIGESAPAFTPGTGVPPLSPPSPPATPSEFPPQPKFKNPL